MLKCILGMVALVGATVVAISVVSSQTEEVRLVPEPKYVRLPGVARPVPCPVAHSRDGYSPPSARPGKPWQPRPPRPGELSADRGPDVAVGDGFALVVYGQGRYCERIDLS